MCSRKSFAQTCVVLDAAHSRNVAILLQLDRLHHILHLIPFLCFVAIKRTLAS